LLAEAAGKPHAIAHDIAALTHAQVGRPAGARHAFESLYAGLVAREPELLD